MGEISGLRFTSKTHLLNLRLQGFELALHRWRRSTTGQPELLRQIRLLQPLLQRFLPTPG